MARSLCTRRIAAIVLAAVLAGAAPAAGAPAPVPRAFKGQALWVKEVLVPQTGRDLVAKAAQAGVRTLYVKAGDGSTPELRFSSALVGEMRAAGATVCGWMFAYGQNPIAEAGIALAAVRDGAQCLVVDAEGQYNSLYGAAQLFLHTLRSQLGAGFPIGLASQAEVAEHPKFPYSVFLGPGGFNVVLPQLYWLDFGTSVDAAFTASIGANSIYGRPVLPIGQLYNAPKTAELTRFRSLDAAYGLGGSSFFDLDIAEPSELAALAAPPHRLARRAVLAPTLHPGADGDEVVQAQELLNAAGAHLPVGGYFGATTARAVGTFQARHRLRASGVITSATWKALLRFRPREPSWANGPPDSAG